MTCTAWPVVYPCDTQDTDADLLAAALAGATDLLWTLTGRRYGDCTAEEAFKVSTCRTTGIPVPWVDSSGYWHNAVCQDSCCVLVPSYTPIRELTEVTVDGTVVAAHVEAGTIVVEAGCPVCSECEAPSILASYTYGVPLPSWAANAVGEVACEILRGMKGEACLLNTRAVQVTRQGVTVDVASADELLSKGLLGLPLADMLIRTLNPSRLTRPSRVVSPDLPMRA